MKHEEFVQIVRLNIRCNGTNTERLMPNGPRSAIRQCSATKWIWSMDVMLSTECGDKTLTLCILFYVYRSIRGDILYAQHWNDNNVDNIPYTYNSALCQLIFETKMRIKPKTKKKHAHTNSIHTERIKSAVARMYFDFYFSWLLACSLAATFIHVI